MVRRLIFEICANCSEKIIDDEKAVLLDDHNDLIFCRESCAKEYFEEEIARLEAEYLKLRAPQDIPVDEHKAYEHFLPVLLNEPDEIWQALTTEEESPLSFYIGEFFHEQDPVFYIAAAYRSEDKPVLIYIHFPTKDLALVEKYRRGELVYDGSQEVEEALEDDEITEGNIAIEIYNEMLENRSEADIDPEDFGGYSDLKLLTVERPEEIWRRIDDSGNTFVVYMAHFQRENEAVAYVVVAVEDEFTDSAIPIFGFPTVDQKLLDRFRTGEMIFRASEGF